MFQPNYFILLFNLFVRVSTSPIRYKKLGNHFAASHDLLFVDASSVILCVVSVSLSFALSLSPSELNFRQLIPVYQHQSGHLHAFKFAIELIHISSLMKYFICGSNEALRTYQHL